MMKMRTDALAIAAIATLVMGTAGCQSPTSTATGEGVGERAGKAVDAGAETVKEGAKDAGKTVAQGAENAGEAVKGAADNAGEAVKGAAHDTKVAVKGAAENTKEAVGGAAKAAGEAVGGVAAVTTLTPKVKNALIVSKQIDASTLNVDTDATKKLVILKGTLPTAEKKALATTIAAKTLADAKSDYKVQNDITVSK